MLSLYAVFFYSIIVGPLTMAHDLADIEYPQIFVTPTGGVPSESRVIGGSKADPNSIPYQVALYISKPKGIAFCGGSLISDNYIITAAHCMEKADLVEVVLGAHDLQKKESSQTRVTCKDIIVHPDWNRQTLENDVALIKLPQPLELNKNIAAIDLAKEGSFASKTALLTGWGRTSDTSKTSTVLNQVSLSVLDNSECETFFENLIKETHMCTSGAEIKGGCNGDSGGPLVVENEQIGIVSFGSNNCTFGYPTVFTRVSKFMQWIENNSDISN